MLKIFISGVVFILFSFNSSALTIRNPLLNQSEQLIFGTLPPSSSGKPSLLVFTSPKCGCTNIQIQTLKNLKSEFKEVFSFYIVDVSQLPRKKIIAYYKAANLDSPVIQDAGFKIVDALNVGTTPTAIIINTDGTQIYKGPISEEIAGKEIPHLKNFLIEFETGKFQKKELQTQGCLIKPGKF